MRRARWLASWNRLRLGLTFCQGADHLAASLLETRQERHWPVVLVHWGTERRADPDDEQRHWARWLTEWGAAIVAGSGSHVTQRTDGHAGELIHYSHGNAVFPESLLGSGNGALWTVRLDPHGSVEGRTVPLAEAGE